LTLRRGQFAYILEIPLFLALNVFLLYNHGIFVITRGRTFMSDAMPHEGHDQHLCYLVEKGMLKNKPEDYKALVKKGKYMCTGCGRIARDPVNLCAPEKL
jgi:hypothetical protein